MIESGSLQAGISVADFGLPPGTALRYERPAAALRGLIPSYAVLDSEVDIWPQATSWSLPGWSRLWIVLTEQPISVKLRNRHYPRLGAAVIYGSTSQAMPIATSGGVTIGVDISPMGWVRLFDAPADHYRDRITPLDHFWPAERVSDLIARVHASDRGPGIKPLLDEFFLAHLPPPHPQEATIAAVHRLLLDPDIQESTAIAAALHLHPRTLLRLCARHFGFGSKLLMRRTRLLRIITNMLIADAIPDFSHAPIGYHDVPHFVRDGQYFLGQTPRQFSMIPMPYTRAVLRARRLVIGAPVALLDEDLHAMLPDIAAAKRPLALEPA